MGNSRYGYDRRVGLDAELFYFFIDFRNLRLDQLNLADEMSDLDFLGSGCSSNGVPCGIFQFFGSKGNAPASAGDFKAFTQRSDVRGCDFASGGEAFQNLHVYSAVFGLEQAVELRENDVNAFLQSVGVDIQLFFQIVMMSGKLPLLIKIEAAGHCDAVGLLA